MKILELLQTVGKSIEDIKQLYHGKDHACRCGCKGRYFEAGTAGFNRALNKMTAASFEPLAKGADMWDTQHQMWTKTEGIEITDEYVNVPYDGEADKCYTLYFS